MLCLGIQWKIRIIFYPTPRILCVCLWVYECMRINYTASILFPFDGFDIWQAFNCGPNPLSLTLMTRFLLLFFTHSFFSLFFFTVPPHSLFTIVRFSYSANQPICRNPTTTFEWTNFKCGTHSHTGWLLFSRHITYYKCSSCPQRALECKEHYGYYYASTISIGSHILKVKMCLINLMACSHGNFAITSYSNQMYWMRNGFWATHTRTHAHTRIENKKIWFSFSGRFFLTL